jgi:long-chain acyl-CoA synthetase
VPEPTPDRPWLAAYPSGVPADVEVPDRPLTDLLDRAAGDLPDRVALDFLGRRTTYADLDRAVDRAAQVLRDRGVGRGDQVALALPTCPQHVVASYAALRAGASVVEHDPWGAAPVLATGLLRHRARVLVAWDRIAAALDAALRAAGGGPPHRLAVRVPDALPWHQRTALGRPGRGRRGGLAAARAVPEDWASWGPAVAGARPSTTVGPGPRPDDPAVLLPTGGASGEPRLAVLSHRHLRVQVAQWLAWAPTLRRGRETVLSALPLWHASGLTAALGFAVAAAATLVLLPRADPATTLAAIRRTRATVVTGVPAMFAGLVDAAEHRPADLASVRFGLSGAAAMPEEVAALWERLTGGLLVEGYASTEYSPVTLANPLSPGRRLGTVGVPLPSTEARIADPDAPDLQRRPGEVGELLVRGPQVPASYADGTASLLPDGWLRTGDAAVMSGDGYVTLLGRPVATGQGCCQRVV